MLPRLTLILGGARSGKSREAEALITGQAPPWRYVATAQALDEEMNERIAQHRARRREGWETHEAPLDLAGTIGELAQDAAPILVDCVTLWLSNLMLGGHDVEAAIAGLESVLDDAWAPIVAVSNEVGLGIVPENALARRFRDEAGRLNQRLAARADRVLLMVAGLKLEVK
jgi:adenosylcobinamide kinase/adenosylcobinamide-phosphate guanylyltransferase